jgi:hypothetical protein
MKRARFTEEQIIGVLREHAKTADMARKHGVSEALQQARFNAFVDEFDRERPHDVYSAPRPYIGLPDLAYPLHDRDMLVTACGPLIISPFLFVRELMAV